MHNFEGFGLSDALNASLSRINYKTPTPIQQQAIPLAMQGLDILGSAQTGTGKTAAFSIPMIDSLMRSSEGSALILTPTRELAKQVLEFVESLLGKDGTLKAALIIGGESMDKQFKQLRHNPRIIVGTPGRVNDHLKRGSLQLRDTGFLVLDETDRMLDMGFGVQLDRIAQHLPKKRQTLMFSATLPKSIVTLSGKYLNNPERVSVGETNVIAENIKQETIRIEQGDKYQELKVQLTARQGSVIVFVKTKHGADRMAKKLRQDGFTSEGLHGDLRQNKREKVMKNFRAQNFRVLVATDIAARGLDVSHIEHVINFDLPQVAEDYIHRMGRTARAGAHGEAVSFITSQDGRKWSAIEYLLNPNMKKKKDDDFGNKRRRSGKKPFRSKHAGEQSDRKNKRPFKSRKKWDNEGENTGDQSERKHKKPFNKAHKKRDYDGEKSAEQTTERKHKKPFKAHKKRDNDGEKAPFEKKGKRKPSRSERTNRDSSTKPFKARTNKKPKQHRKGSSQGHGQSQGQKPRTRAA